VGQAKKNKRDCPVAGHVISPAECGDGRRSRHACPESCPHNPWAAANYERALQIEDGLTAKMMRRLNQPPPSVTGDDVAAMWQMTQFYMERFHLDRDSQGRDFFAQWEAAGWDGLTNDERVLARGKAASRLALIEVHEVRAGNCVVVDLLAPAAVPFVVHDHGFSVNATRFTQILSWMFPMPHYHRLNGNGLGLPDVTGYDGLDVVRETSRHLGGPMEPEPLRDWLARNFPRVAESFHASRIALRDQMFQALDARFTTATYRLTGTTGQLLRLLDKLTAVAPDELNDEERVEDFLHAYDWFAEPTPATPNQPQLPLPDEQIDGFGRPLLGRVLVGMANVRLTAGSAARYQSLRAQFEKLAGRLVEFTAERVDDVAAQFRQRHAEPYNAALVPPRFLEHPPRMIMQTSRVEHDAVPAGLSPTELAAYSQQQYLKSYPDQPVPALDGRTPRQAAADPLRRPQLVILLKHFVRSHDQRNLQTGRTDDVNWLLRELGVTELLFAPPPPRPIPVPAAEEMDDDSLFDDLPLPPPLPAEPLTEDAVLDRLEEIGRGYSHPDDMLNDFEDLAPDLAELVERLTAKSGGEYDLDVLLMASGELWFCFFPPGTQPAAVDPERLQQGFAEAMRLVAASPESAARVLSSGRQPNLVTAIASHTIESCRKKPLRNKVALECLLLLPIFLHALANELDQVLRDLHTP
jgi:hypothetical protein